MNYFQKAANTFSAAFVTAKRVEDGAEFAKLGPDAAQWMKDAARKAHGDRFPDDTIYTLCDSAASWIAENYEDVEDARENAGEFADAQVDVYNHDRTAWLHKHPAHIDYVGQAIEEMGRQQDLLGDIGMGQYMQAQEVYCAILSAIDAEAETEEACDFREKTERE